MTQKFNETLLVLLCLFIKW